MVRDETRLLVVAVVFSTHPCHVRGASLVPYSAMLDVPHEVVEHVRGSSTPEGVN